MVDGSVYMILGMLRQARQDIFNLGILEER
jgi:hypothetical protein